MGASLSIRSKVEKMTPETLASAESVLGPKNKWTHEDMIVAIEVFSTLDKAYANRLVDHNNPG